MLALFFAAFHVLMRVEMVTGVSSFCVVQVGLDWTGTAGMDWTGPDRD